ncbi:MAG: LysE family transporter [Gammaproteobacteria bacterium]
MAAAVRAFLFGIVVASAVGPIAILIVHLGLKHGGGMAVRAAFGAAFGDFTFALIALAVGASLVAILEDHRAVFAVVSGVVLLVLGSYLIIRTLRSGATTEPTQGNRIHGFWLTYTLTMVNPLTILIFLAFSAQLAAVGSAGSILVYGLLIFSGSLLVQLTLAGIGAGLKARISDQRVIRTLNVLSGLGIVAFGVFGLRQVI